MQHLTHDSWISDREQAGEGERTDGNGSTSRRMTGGGRRMRQTRSLRPAEFEKDLRNRKVVWGELEERDKRRYAKELFDI